MELRMGFLTGQAIDLLISRNDTSSSFFQEEAMRLAVQCREMADRFESGGRLLAIGRGPHATDAQHISVEFVHPVIVGKRALPAIDATPYFDGRLRIPIGEHDILMGLGPPGGDPEVEAELAHCHERGILTFALPGGVGHYATPAPSADPFIHQELIEILYHTLWETVHVFFEHREMGHDVGESSFLYPFLGSARQDTTAVLEDVAASIETKAGEVERLRIGVAEDGSDDLVRAAVAVNARLLEGGKLLMFGNGGSATDANDFAFDCVMPPTEMEPIPALSLSLEPANLTAVANDIGVEATFLRQLIAHGRSRDVAVAFSTSGGSANIIAALKEARKRGLLTIAFLGYDGGEIARKKLADFALVVDSDHIPRIQEVHASMYHTLRELIETVRIHGVT